MNSAFASTSNPYKDLNFESTSTSNPYMDFLHSCEGHSTRSASVTSASSTATACHLCGYESGRISNLKRHIKKMHSSNTVQDLYCCEIRFQDKAKYRDHCRQFHKNGHACPTCGRVFSRRALLRRHQSVHTGLKDFHCDQCYYASSHKSNLERHLKTHTGQGRSRKGPSNTETQVQPDSTTASTTPSFPILRDMLRADRKVKPTLSHSIESILKRKDRPKPRQNFPPSSSTLTSSSVLLPSPVPTWTPARPIFPEVNWVVRGSPGLIPNQNQASAITPALRNLSFGDNSLPVVAWAPQEESRVEAHYLSNLFSPHYLSLLYGSSNYYPQPQHPPLLPFNNPESLPALFPLPFNNY